MLDVFKTWIAELASKLDVPGTKVTAEQLGEHVSDLLNADPVTGFDNGAIQLSSGKEIVVGEQRPVWLDDSGSTAAII